MSHHRAFLSRATCIGVAMLASASLAAQESNGWHPVFIVTTGVAMPLGELARETSASPNIYVGLAFHHGASRTTFEVGESFTTFSSRQNERGTIAIAAFTVTRFVPLRRGVEAYGSLGAGQSYVGGNALNNGPMRDISRLGLALIGGTGVRVGGHVGLVLGLDYVALMHDGGTLQVMPLSIGINIR